MIDNAPLHRSVYVGLETDGTVYIVAHRSEMGTSSRPSVPMVRADELDADWSRVKITQAIGDPRYVVNPDRTKSPFEGAAVFGTSIARYGEITAKNGAVEQSNFHDYQVTRLPEAPRQTNVHIVENDAPPAGVGEPGVPPFVPAFCNAIYVATGKRVRELPLSKTNFSKSAKG